MTRARLAAVLDLLTGLALAAWIGGHAALGAFGARIAFRTLPRADAARTMTQVFHEFDRLILAALAVVAVAALLGAWARGLGRRAQVRLGLELGLCALGLFEVLHVHHTIEGMFEAGRTLEPAFAAAHRLSERCAHLEVLLFAAWMLVRGWPDAEPAP